MATHSIVSYAHLARSKRTDAEYYQPKYLALNELYKRGRWLPIRKHLAACDYGISIKMNTEGDGYPIFRMDNLENGFAFDDEMKYAPITEATFNVFRLEPDDILFNRVNSEEFVGRTGIFKLPGDYVFASYLIRARTMESLSPDVLNLFLNCKYGVLSIKRLSRRAVNQANVNAQELQSILIPQFSDAFQRTLAQLSNQAWSLHAQSKDKYSRVEQTLLRDIGIEMWRPKHQLTYVRRSNEAMRAQRFDAEYFQPKFQEMFAKIGEGVNLIPLGKLVTLTKGIEVGSDAYVDSGMPFWRVSNLTRRGFDDSSLNFVSEELYDSLRVEYEPKQGELLLSKDATPGIAFYLEHPIIGIASSGILRLEFISDIAPHYLELVLNSTFVQLQIEQNAGGSIIKHWKPS